ncbi:DsbA family protein [Natrialbaceae archaeon A-arb3/5]
MSDTADRLVLYADYVCPFCYLGTRSLEQCLDGLENPPEIDWRPFDLRRGKRNPDGSIDHSVDDGKDDEYFEQARSNVRRLQDEYGVEMTQELALEVDSFDAQLAGWYVKQEYPEQWAAFDEAIYEALWRDERDIGDESVLADLAADVSLPAEEIEAALDNESLRADLDERFSAAQRLGVTGVPTFVFDGRAANGAVPPAQLERLLSAGESGR